VAALVPVRLLPEQRLSEGRTMEEEIPQRIKIPGAVGAIIIAPNFNIIISDYDLFRALVEYFYALIRGGIKGVVIQLGQDVAEALAKGVGNLVVDGHMGRSITHAIMGELERPGSTAGQAYRETGTARVFIPCIMSCDGQVETGFLYGLVMTPQMQFRVSILNPVNGKSLFEPQILYAATKRGNQYVVPSPTQAGPTGKRYYMANRTNT
jgi:hypothetical protein